MSKQAKARRVYEDIELQLRDAIGRWEDENDHAEWLRAREAVYKLERKLAEAKDALSEVSK